MAVRHAGAHCFTPVAAEIQLAITEAKVGAYRSVLKESTQKMHRHPSQVGQSLGPIPLHHLLNRGTWLPDRQIKVKNIYVLWLLVWCILLDGTLIGSFKLEN